MITQIRIDGFKSFVGFQLDVHPVTVLLGVNGAGKSNLFDALRLVSGIIHRGVRDTLSGDRRLAAHTLFHRGEGAPARDLEVMVGAVTETEDGPLPITIRVALRGGSKPFLDVYRSRVRLSGLRQTDWTDRLGYSAACRAELVAARQAFLARTPSGPEHTWLHTDQMPEPGADYFHEGLYEVAQQECATWFPYALEPTALRELGRPEDDGPLRPDGRNLAVVLDRISRESPERFTRLVADLAAIVPGARGIRTETIRTRGELDFEVEFQHTGWISPASLSDGTLRALALLAASWDQANPGTLLVEEVENGMHLTQVAELVRRLSRNVGLAADARGQSARQLILTTHSPALLAALRGDLSGSLVFLEQANRVDPESGAVSRVTAARPLRERGATDDPGESISPQAVTRLLRRLGQEVS
ncbi:hypothetical protein CFP65_5075 [Kitasatospora sp. MMS16-BH015]|uniref:AAA family ATPase n=1 Tax=Kitasatospora sp. MMS16-BH015 TaxID=2018025 RepID=UPI000CA27B96|nr:AAA family ATPase [Kitasatospora sp. MMS16-BH015]AUG79787.1 hypothetical protein CFP65_5075 [Kitasatospora sp. MMS16-BH015]